MGRTRWVTERLGRDGPPEFGSSLIAALSRARQVRELAELVGSAALGETDRHYLQLVEVFESELVDQRQDESRTLDQTLDRAWRVAAVLPRQELTMLPAALLDAHLDPRERAP
jgi:V/A-type H+/Na+-transporting ATPase subunit B